MRSRCPPFEALLEKPSAKATTPRASEPCLFGPLIHAQTQAILPTNLPCRLYPLLGVLSGADRQLFAVTAREPNGERVNQDIQDIQDGNGLESLPPNAWLGCWHRADLGVLCRKMDQVFICQILTSLFIWAHLRRPWR